MGYRIAGTYITNCNCRLVCPCPFDGTPTGPDDECKGVVVFHLSAGNLDAVDLSGVNFAWYNVFPSNFSAGNWKVQFVVDDKASDAQLDAIMRILSGQEGGFFADFVPMVGEVLPVSRAPITVTAGDNPSAVVGDQSTVGFEPILGPDGAPATGGNAPFAFGPEFKIGRGAGTSAGPFGAIEHVYGETAEFEVSDAPVG